jgi:hypothetical protein
MSSTKKTGTKGNTRFITKPVLPTVRPTVSTALTVKGDKDLGDYIKVIFVRTTGQMEVVYHHPVGVTPHDDDEWVATDPTEVGHLLARRTDSSAARRNTELEDFKTTKLLETNLVVADQEGNLVYPDSSHLKDRFQFLADIKDAKKKDKRFDRRTYLADLKDPRSDLELKLDAVKHSSTVEFEIMYPNPYETMGGARADHPQKPLPWAKGLTIADLQDALFAACIAGPPAEETQAGMALYGATARADETIIEGTNFSEIVPRVRFSTLDYKSRALIQKSIADIRKTLINNGLGDIQVGYRTISE